MEELVSKVAICEKCQSFLKACHMSLYRRHERKYKKEFSELEKLGFTVKLETYEATRARNWSFGEEMEKCKKGECPDIKQILKYLE